MNNKQYGFGGGCAELGLVASVFVACVVFAIALAAKLHAGMTFPFAALQALTAAAIVFGGIVALWLTAYAAISVLFRNKE